MQLLQCNTQISNINITILLQQYLSEGDIDCMKLCTDLLYTTHCYGKNRA